jgi:2'-5' RNA ligase
MEHFGIFIEPTGSLADSIRALKAEVECQLPGHKFCSHPPHSTLIYGQYQEPKLWRDQLAAALAELPPFRIQTTEFGFFYDDALAGGGHTVVFKAQPVPEVFALQRACGDVLKHWRNPGEPARGGLLEREPFRSSYAEYGFPFVGPHWIPHFTIASLKVTKDAPLLRTLTAGDARHAFQLDRVSVWEIAGDSHAKLFEVPLGK